MSEAAFFKLLVVALSLGLDVFAVCVGVGMRGADRGLKFRIGAAFCVAEISMVGAGAALGRVAGQLLGDAAGYLGFAALVGVGIYMVLEARHRTGEMRFDLSRGTGLLIGSLAISIDSLGIGFSILYIGVPLGISLVTIAVVSVASTTLGLTLGRLLGQWAEDAAALWAGIVLIATGVGFATMKGAGIAG